MESKVKSMSVKSKESRVKQFFWPINSICKYLATFFGLATVGSIQKVCIILSLPSGSSVVYGNIKKDIWRSGRP